MRAYVRRTRASRPSGAIFDPPVLCAMLCNRHARLHACRGLRASNGFKFPVSPYLRTPQNSGDTERVKRENTGKKRPLRARTPQNKHSGEFKTLKKRKKRRIIKYLTEDEKEALFAAIPSVRDRAIFRLAYHHGLRASEIGILQLADYRRGASTHMDRINLRRLKGSLGGETAVVQTAGAAIRAWLRERGSVPGPLFPSRNHRGISRAALDDLMKRYCEWADIPREKAHFHTLKHSCATHLLSGRRESIVDVQRQLGHADIRSTMAYAELTDQANTARAQRLRDWR